MVDELKRTRLFEWHQDNGARMAPFGEFEMPLWYASAKEEHLSVLRHSGLFDTSHMDILLVRGRHGQNLLQWCCSRDLEACIAGNKRPLEPGWSVYTVILNNLGHVIDDAIISRLDTDSYLVVVNASMGSRIRDHFIDQKKGLNSEVILLDDCLAKIDLQGPFSGHILSKVLSDPNQVLTPPFGFFSFKGGLDPNKFTPTSDVSLKNNIPLILSRSGYTGEFGFELFVSVENMPRAWETIFEAGQEYNLRPCGLASRDSLRAGAVLPLSHQDIGDWPFLKNPWIFALPWNQDGSGFTKDFLGKDGLLGVTEPRFTYPFVGYDLRKVSTGQGLVQSASGEDIGHVLTCVTDMGIDWYDQRIFSINSPGKPADFQPRGLSCGFVRLNKFVPFAREVRLLDKRRSLKVKLVKDIRPDRTARKPFQDMVTY